MAHTNDDASNDRIFTALLALGALALVGLVANGFGAGFIDALGQVARAIASAAGASKTVAKAVEVGAEALGRIAKIFLF